MSSSVNVTSLEEFEDFHATLVTFVDQANEGLLAVDMETRRFVDWLRHDRPRYWHQAQQRCSDEMAEARAALMRKKLRKMDDGREPDTTEEEKDLRQAKRKQEYIEERIANTRKWGTLIDRPVDEYLGQARQLGMLLEGDPPPMVRLVRGALNSLEAYMAIQAPQAPSDSNPLSPGEGRVRVGQSQKASEAVDNDIDPPLRDESSALSTSSEAPS